MINGLFVDARTWVIAAAILAGGAALLLAAHFVVFFIAKKLARKHEKGVLAILLKSIEGPTRLLALVAGLMMALPITKIPQNVRQTTAHTLGLALVAALGWMFVGLARFLMRFIESRFRADLTDNLTARRVRTQTQVIEHVLNAGIVIVTIAVMLMTFPNVRQIGASVLASAGIAGLVIGMAAKSTFSNLIAGLQVAITQPIRLEDAVVVESEWGWIEEITTTYVVVRIWDLRRLVVPLSYFIEHPFQNWTRQTSEILPTVMIYADYTVPVEEVRQELQRILQGTDLWNKQAWGLQVTDLTDKTMQLRALMSASDSGKAFDLQCLVREKLVQFLKKNHPDSLPVQRERVFVAGNGQLPIQSQTHEPSAAR